MLSDEAAAPGLRCGGGRAVTGAGVGLVQSRKTVPHVGENNKFVGEFV